jgi:hypothetical protein
MITVPEMGVVMRKAAICPNVPLDDPRRDSLINVFAGVVSRDLGYEIVRKVVQFDRYQGLRTGRISLDVIILTPAEYQELAMQCYQQGLQAASMHDYYIDHGVKEKG